MILISIYICLSLKHKTTPGILQIGFTVESIKLSQN